MRIGILAGVFGVAVSWGALAPVYAQSGQTKDEGTASTDAGEQAVEQGHAGLKAFEAGQWRVALEHFEAAEALSHSPVFELYIARSLRNLGRLLDARDRFQSAIGASMADSAPTAWKQAQINGRAELAALNERIPSLSIQVSTAAEQWSAKLNGKPIAANGPVPVDPGTYEVKVTSGGKERVQTANAREGDGTLVLTFDFSTDAPSGAIAAQKGAVPNADAPGSDGPLWPGAALLVAGGVGLGVGAVTGFVALSKADTLKQACGDDERCSPDLAPDGESVENVALVSTLGFIVGGVLATAGITLLVLRPGGQSGATVNDGASGLAIKLGVTGASLHGQF